jgi:RecG-like helicase
MNVQTIMERYQMTTEQSLYEWQYRAFPGVISDLQTSPAASVKGGMGCGKTTIAMMTAQFYLSRKEGSLIVITSPLIVLARQLLQDAQEIFTGMLPEDAFALHAGTAVGPITSPTQIISMTYEHAQIFLASAQEMADRIALVVVDKVHEIGSGRRGLAIREIIGVAWILRRPCLFMSGTLSDGLRGFFELKLDVPRWQEGVRLID